MKRTVIKFKNMPAGAKKIISVLHKKGHKAYLVGGCVRDNIMKSKSSDFDIATSAVPKEVTSLFKKCILVGAKFGVIRVRMFQKEYEVATFRKDINYKDGRHPENVAFCGEKEDVARRDFTVNGLLYDIKKNTVIDYVGGQKDIAARTIRSIGEPKLRYREDKLRMLRAVRFSCQLNFSIDTKTLNAIKANAPKIRSISAERIRDELTKILIGPNSKKGLMIMHKTGLLREILPEVEAMVNVAQPPEFHKLGDVFMHTLGLFDHLKNPSVALAYASLLHDIGKPLTQTLKDRIRFNGHVEEGEKLARDICTRLKLSSRTIDAISELVAHHMRFMDVKKMRESTLKRFFRIKNFGDHLKLHKADCLASHGDLTNHIFCSNKLRGFNRSRTKDVLKPAPLVTGHDLISMGLKPGPLFSRILQELETLQLEGVLKTSSQAGKYVKEHFILTSSSPLS